MRYYVLSVSDNECLRSFSSRKDAVYWCKVNQISSLPDGSWEDDYSIVEGDSSA